MSFNVKKNQGFLIAEGVALVLLIVCVVAWRVSVSSQRAEVEGYLSSNDEYTSITKKYNGEPTKKLVAEYGKKLEKAKQQETDIRVAVKVEPLPTFTPNAFKVALRESTDKYNQIRNDLNVITPEDYGWGEFLGDIDPKEKQLPTLVRQYSLITDMLDVLFANNVDEIIEIDRNPTGESFTSDDDFEMFENGPTGGSRTGKTAEEAFGDKKLYDSVPVKFSFRVSPSKLYDVLAELRNKPKFYTIGEIKTDLDVMSSGDVKDPSDIKEILAVTLIANHIELL